MSRVIIIGGGPAGIMAAIAASKEHSVVLLEQNNKLGKKLFITGKGRCNVTNNVDISEFFNNIPRNSNFLYSAFYGYTNEDVKTFFEDANVPLKVERGDRVFPSSDKSSDIIRALENELHKQKVEIRLNTKVIDILFEGNKISHLKLQNGENIKGDYYILATGGASYPQTGSTGDGYKFSKKLGHNVNSIVPSLIPMICKEPWISELQGLSLKNVEINFKTNNKVLFKDFGEMLFTHYGISGPLVLSASAKIPIDKIKQGVDVYIDLKPALTADELDNRIQKDFKKYINKDFKNALGDLLPNKLIDIIIRLSEIDENKKVNSITKVERKHLVSLFKAFHLNVIDYRPISEAIITSGGIDTKEINSSTMKSKLVDNLCFAGEIIDTHGYTGGFNLQIAFSTGHLAGKSI